MVKFADAACPSLTPPKSKFTGLMDRASSGFMPLSGTLKSMSLAYAEPWLSASKVKLADTANLVRRNWGSIGQPFQRGTRSK
jgi:hypothetical protein